MIQSAVRVAESLAAQHFPPALLRPLQWGRVSEMLDWCWREVPYYQRIWREAGLRPGDSHSAWFRSVPQPQLGGRFMMLPQARVLGGGSVVNGMMELHGNVANYDAWGALGNPGWSFAEVMPYFLRSEDHERGRSPFHGSGGPIPVSEVRYKPAFSEAFIEAEIEAGLPRNDDFNGPSQLGVGFYEHAQRRGRRVTARAYFKLPRRAPLDIVCGATVLKLRFEGDRAVGVE